MRQLIISKSITNRTSASLDKYLADISKHEMITAAEEVLLAEKIRSGDEAALVRLTTANLRFVVSVAKQYQNQGLALSDLISEGNLGLIKAARRFDETRGFKFISYAVWWIRQSIVQAVSEQSRMIRLPLNKVGILSKIRKMSNLLEQELEREPSAEEIAESMLLPADTVSVALSVAGKHQSIDASLNAEDGFSLMDVIENDNSPQPDLNLISSSLNKDVQRVLATLTQRERDFVTLYYGLGGSSKFTLEEIGTLYDLTRERVRQVVVKSIRKMKHTSRSNLLQAYV